MHAECIEIFLGSKQPLRSRSPPQRPLARERNSSWHAPEALNRTERDEWRDQNEAVVTLNRGGVFV